MALRIEDYALIGDNETAALVGRDGSIDWLCVPRFDAGACFAALLGTAENGRWRIAPRGAVTRTRRRYRGATLVLETEFETADGVVRLVDCMTPRQRLPDVIRLVEGVRGSVAMEMELEIRFDYGSIVPWVRRMPDGTLSAIAGPDALCLQTPVSHEGRGLATVASFTVQAGERVPFSLVWHPSTESPPPACDALAAVAGVERHWEAWSARSTYDGEWRDAVQRSLLTLKALAYAPTGGMMAAPTTSLPECLGGVRNWDYRYCWLRDATFSLYALMLAGYVDEAKAWRDWLLRAVAGRPSDLQSLYGPAGERRIPELELGWLPGYEASAPVRIGNAAVHQFQLDVYGELLDSMYIARRAGLEPEPHAWPLQRALLEFLERGWREPDEGIWEVRGPPPPLHALEGDGVGGLRPRGEVRRALRLPGPGGPVARAARRGSRRGVRARVRQGPAELRPALRQRPARREPPHDPARRLPAGERPAHARDRRGDRARARRRRLRAPLRARDGPDGGRAPARRGHVPPLLVLARRQPGAARTPR
jgi:GH15 family glucan-1,4-alpha-glucosidase